MSELFLTIFNTAVTAGWLVLAVLVARLLLKNAPSWAKCALWAIVGLRLIWPFELESILSLVPSAQTLPPEVLYDTTPEIHTGISYLNSTINPTFTQTFQPDPAASVNPLQVVVFIASVVWVIGMVIMAAYAAFSYLRLRRRVTVSMPAGEGVYLCDTISSPFILGLVKPKIYLPSELPQEQWDAILSHERAHLARRDHWWKPLGFALLTVFWFHPLLWVAYIFLCRDVELACDEKVIKALSLEEKQAYSQTLLECSMPRKWITACPLAFGETSVKQRIKAVLHYKKPTLWIIIAALVICSVLAVCFLTDPAEKPDESSAITAADISGKQYVYTKPGAGSEFYINIYQNGTFQYYAGVFSSHIGLGDWELKDGKLYLYDTTLTNPMTFVFSVEENTLAYIAAESHPFMYVQVADGDLFRYYADIPLREGRDIPGPAEVWHPVYQVIGLESGSFHLNAFPDHTFRWGDGKIEIVKAGVAVSLVEHATIYHLGAVDLNLDGYPELCTTVNTEKDGEHVIIHDIINQKTYQMLDSTGENIYYLYTEYEDGSYYVMCARDDVQTGKAVEAGRLILAEDGKGFTPAILAPTLDSLSTDAVTVLFDRDHPDSAHQGEVELRGFPGVSVRWYFTPNAFLGSENPVLVKAGKETTLFANYPSPRSLYIADVTGDGKQDLCADVYYFFSGLPSFNAVCVYDYANDRYYLLADSANTGHYTKVSYDLRIEAGQLVCDKIAVSSGSVLETGSLFLLQPEENPILCMRPALVYESPVDYVYSGAHGLDRVTLTIIHEGTCRLHYGYKPEGGVYVSGSLQGTYTKTSEKLVFTTEDGARYIFRLKGEDLVFVAKGSAQLPENCILYDGAILKASRRYE